MQKNVRISIIIGVVVVAFLAGYALTQYVSYQSSEGSEDNLNTSLSSSSPSTAPTPLPERKSRSPLSEEASLTYQSAMEMFEGKRIQFDNCTPTPSSFTVKSGTRVMLDNRSPEGIELKVGAATYRLYEYDFAIVTLRSQTLPVTVQIDCQSGDEIRKNAAQVVLQK